MRSWRRPSAISSVLPTSASTRWRSSSTGSTDRPDASTPGGSWLRRPFSGSAEARSSRARRRAGPRGVPPADSERARRLVCLLLVRPRDRGCLPGRCGVSAFHGRHGVSRSYPSVLPLREAQPTPLPIRVSRPPAHESYCVCGGQSLLRPSASRVLARPASCSTAWPSSAPARPCSCCRGVGRAGRVRRSG